MIILTVLIYLCIILWLTSWWTFINLCLNQIQRHIATIISTSKTTERRVLHFLFIIIKLHIVIVIILAINISYRTLGLQKSLALRKLNPIIKFHIFILKQRFFKLCIKLFFIKIIIVIEFFISNFLTWFLELA